MDKLSINNEMRVFDNKDRNFYDSLTDEERKKFSNFLMIRYGSSVNGSRDLQEFYLISTNQRLNKHFFAVGKHPKLQWLMATSVSPDMGGMRHNWIAQKKKEPGGNNVKKHLADLFPNMKTDEIELLATLTPKKDLDAYLLRMGREKSK